MGIRNIGEVIQSLRKDKSVTQEELANYVGVSAQAVSKWECGGVPDTELIPAIADYFEVSIDTLFGRTISDYMDLSSAIEKRIWSIDRDKQFYTAFELIWDIQKSLGGISETKLSEISDENHFFSHIRWNTGISIMDLSFESPYALFIPESDKRSEWLLKDIDYISFFKVLSEQDVFDTLIFLYKKEKKAFTLKLIEKAVNISEERAKEIVDILKKYNMVTSTQVEFDDTIQNIYTSNHNPEFFAFLTFAHDIIKSPNSYYIYNGGHDKPYL